MKSRGNNQINSSDQSGSFRGELCSLISAVKPEYDLAIKIALGPALHYLIVDDAEGAKRCNSLLRERGLARDVLILENIPERNLGASTNSLRNKLGNLGHLIFDVVKIQPNIPRLDAALLYLLRGKVVSHTLKEAYSIRN